MIQWLSLCYSKSTARFSNWTWIPSFFDIIWFRNKNAFVPIFTSWVNMIVRWIFRKQKTVLNELMVLFGYFSGKLKICVKIPKKNLIHCYIQQNVDTLSGIKCVACRLYRLKPILLQGYYGSKYINENN